MRNQLLNESFIRQRSGELQIPFENLLAASVLEEIVQRIAQSEYAENFWMKNSVRLSLENYKKKVDRELCFCIKDTEKLHYKKTELSQVFSELFRNYKKDTVHWNYNLSQDWNITYANLIAAISLIKVPVKITMECLKEEDLKPYVKDIRLFTNNNRSIRLNCFPSEYVIVEKFLEVIQKLELINDLTCYLDIYDILKKEALSGRKVSELLQDKCEACGIHPDEERLELLLSYRTSSYMKKKWKSFMRHKKMKSPDWDEMLQMIDTFFSAIWRHICRNLIYLGDWIPELGRFID